MVGRETSIQNKILGFYEPASRVVKKQNNDFFQQKKLVIRYHVSNRQQLQLKTQGFPVVNPIKIMYSRLRTN